MKTFTVTVTIQAETIQGAVNRLLFPDGTPIKGVTEVSAMEEEE